MPYVRTLVLCLALATLAAAPATAPTTTPATQPVPLLTPEAELETFNLPEGLVAQVVASEPLVQHPVAISFDADGRLWVVEMRNYMPDTSGWGETKPTGRISILHDTDNDGRMDKSTVFLDKLVLPRAIGFANGGVLIGTPPNLLFCRDTNGDDIADQTTIVATDYGVPENPENFANGLLWGLDNWIYNAAHSKRLRPFALSNATPASRSSTQPTNLFEFSPIPTLGQYGITHDDYGRFFFNTNSDHLRGSLVPPHYRIAQPHQPDVDRRYPHRHRSGDLPRTPDDGEPRLPRRASSAPTARSPPSPPPVRHTSTVGTLLPDFYGNAFVCDPSANVVRRSIITEQGAKLSARNAYDNREFIASTYERFRPVNIQTGPDGALYIVDMHHGLIQHRISITQYAKENYKAKQLDKHLSTGRIFRIVPARSMGVPPMPPRKLTALPTNDLVQLLTHKNGWLRDTAQRLLIERTDPTSVDALRHLAHDGEHWTHRLHALWTLDGIDQLINPTIALALHDPEPKIRAAAIRLSEYRLTDPALRSEVIKLKDDAAPLVQVQFALSLSGIEHPLHPAYPVAELAIRDLLLIRGGDDGLRQPVISGLAHRELSFLTGIFSDSAWSDFADSRHDTICDIARSITRRHQPDEMLALVNLIASAPTVGATAASPSSRASASASQLTLQPWHQLALLESIPETKKDAHGITRPIELPARPDSLTRLANSSNPDIRKRAAKVEALFTWPGKPQPPRPPVKPLTASEQQLFNQGAVVFAKTCAACHQPTGLGAEGKAPPLVGSPWVAGPDTRLIRIVLHGVRGPIAVASSTFNLDMPALSSLSDTEIAAVLTFVRRSFGHSGDPIDPAKVQNIRDWTQARKDGWTEKELLEIR
jgi:putative membrane-bound dehydrogenase-like protein